LKLAIAAFVRCRSRVCLYAIFDYFAYAGVFACVRVAACVLVLVPHDVATEHAARLPVAKLMLKLKPLKCC